MKIIYKEQGREAYADWSITDFELAKQMAADAIEIGTADSVDIVDDEGNLMYYLPRALTPTNRH